MSESTYDPRFVEGVRLFNECEFFDAHDVWEEYWTEYHGPSRDFLKGLIQTAVCLHHFGNDNFRGARKLYHTSRGYLDAFRPRHMGLDVDLLLDQMAVCCQDILTEDEAALAEVVLIPDNIPEIHLDVE